MALVAALRKPLVPPETHTMSFTALSTNAHPTTRRGRRVGQKRVEAVSAAVPLTTRSAAARRPSVQTTPAGGVRHTNASTIDTAARIAPAPARGRPAFTIRKRPTTV